MTLPRDAVTEVILVCSRARGVAATFPSCPGRDLGWFVRRTVPYAAVSAFRHGSITFGGPGPMIALNSSVRRSVTLAVVLLGLLVAAVSRPAAYGDTQPPAPSSPATVSTDPLPTVQVDGVVWTQVIVGNTVYVGGSFATARPAGAARGVNTVPRSNFLAYDLNTGALLPFAPTFNAQIRAMAVSPDQKTLYVGGQFTQVNGVNRYRLVAFDLATGAVLTLVHGDDGRRGVRPRGHRDSAVRGRHLLQGQRPRAATARAPSTPAPAPCCLSRSRRPAGRSGTSWCRRTVRRWCSAAASPA